MFTGKDLIIYILEHDMVNEAILLSMAEAAIRKDVGLATINAYIRMKGIDTIDINGTIYIINNDKFKSIGKVI